MIANIIGEYISQLCHNRFNCVCIHVLSREVQVHCSLFGQDMLLAILSESQKLTQIDNKNLVIIQPNIHSIHHL